jgi:hypothetical protein
MIAMIVALITVFGYASIASEMALSRQLGLTHEAEVASKISAHETSINLVQIGSELEAHLVRESEWQEQEEQTFERERELEEDLRGNLHQQFFKLFGEMIDDLKNSQDALSDAQKQAQLVTLEKHKRKIGTILDGLVGGYGDKMAEVAKVYLERARTQSKHARGRLKDLHRSFLFCYFPKQVLSQMVGSVV